MQEPGIKEKVIQMLWEKQFEGSPWQGKFHLIRRDSLEADYGALADQIISAVMTDVRECFVLTDRRQPWKQEKSDYSWACRDSDGTLFRVSHVIDERAQWHWAIAWQEEDGLRIGSALFASLEKAKECVEGLCTEAAAIT